MKKTLTAIWTVILIAVMLDAVILFFGMFQVAIEGRTGEWNPFWRTQAEFLINLIP